MPPELQDASIQVDRAKSKQIATIICEEIKDSLAKNGKVYNLSERCENQYAQITKWMAAGKEVTVPWKNAADYFIPMTEWIIDAVHARTMNVLFSQEPYMEATGVESSDVAKAPAITEFVDMILREKVKLRQNISFFFKQKIKLPFAVLKYDIVKEFDRIISKQKAMVFVHPETQDKQSFLPDNPESQAQIMQLMASGYQPAGEEENWVSEDKAIENGPKLQYIKFADYVWCPFSKRGSRVYWEGDRFWMTINEMVLKAIQTKFIQESVDLIKRAANTDGKEGTDRIIAQRGEPRECFHWFGRFPFNKNNEIDFNDQDAIEQEVYCCVDYKEQELLEISRWYHRRVPYPERVYIRGEFEETEEFIGRSLAQKLYMTQKELNSLHNTVMDNAWISMQKIFVKKSTLTGEEWEKPVLFPGVMWTEDMQGDIRVLDVGDVKAISMEMEQTLLNFAERISNISIFQTGANREDGGQKTLGEVQKTIQEGNIGLDRLVQDNHELLRRICQWTVDYYYEYMPPGLERRITGESGETIYPTSENAGVYQEKGISQQWSQDNLAGQFDFIWRGTSLNSNKEWNLAVANDLMDRMLPQPMIGGSMLYTWEILKTNFTARNIKDWQKYMPKREMIIQEMQRMATEAQAREVSPMPTPPQPGQMDVGEMLGKMGGQNVRV